MPSKAFLKPKPFSYFVFAVSVCFSGLGALTWWHQFFGGINQAQVKVCMQAWSCRKERRQKRQLNWMRAHARSRKECAKDWFALANKSLHYVLVTAHLSARYKGRSLVNIQERRLCVCCTVHYSVFARPLGSQQPAVGLR